MIDESFLELYIFLTDKCNLSCQHCIANSSPTAQKFRLVSSDVESIVQLVNSNNNINWIHFIGGEPSLAIESISLIQSRVRPEVKFAMTTNGWFGNHPSTILDRMRIDKIIISVDRFHEDSGVSREKIKSLISYSTKLGLDTRIKFTFENPIEISNVADLLIDGVKLIPNRIEYGGRGRELNSRVSISENFTEAYCPSVPAKKSGIESMVYFPKNGITPCCSNLVFNSDSGTGEAWMFSVASDDYRTQNILRNRLKGNFREQYSKVGLNIDKLDKLTACEYCEKLYSKKAQLSGFSIFDLAEKLMMQDKFTFSISGAIDSDTICLFEERFRITYLTVGNFENENNQLSSLNKWSNFENGNYFEVEQISVDEIDFLTTFSQEIMINSQAKLSPREHELNETAIRNFIKMGTANFIYKIDGVPVGELIVLESIIHPQLQEDVCHVGFLGLVNNLKDKNIRGKIKDDMREKIGNLSGSRRVSGKISANNLSSLMNARKMGRKPVAVTFERKPV